MRTVLASAIGVALGIGGCVAGARTEIIVVVEADDAVERQTTDLAVRVRAGPSATTFGPGVSYEVEPVKFPLVVAVVPRDDDASRRFEVEVRARAGERSVGLARARVPFVEGKTMVLRLRLDERCAMVAESCGEEQTCRAGECADVQFVLVADLEPFTPASIPDAATRDSPTAALDVDALDAAPRDAGFDGATRDAGLDGARPDAGADSGTRDAGPPPPCESVAPMVVAPSGYLADIEARADHGFAVLYGTAKGPSVAQVTAFGEALETDVLTPGGVGPALAAVPPQIVTFQGALKVAWVRNTAPELVVADAFTGGELREIDAPGVTAFALVAGEPDLGLLAVRADELVLYQIRGDLLTHAETRAPWSPAPTDPTAVWQDSAFLVSFLQDGTVRTFATPWDIATMGAVGASDVSGVASTAIDDGPRRLLATAIGPSAFRLGSLDVGSSLSSSTSFPLPGASAVALADLVRARGGVQLTRFRRTLDGGTPQIETDTIAPGDGGGLTLSDAGVVPLDPVIRDAVRIEQAWNGSTLGIVISTRSVAGDDVYFAAVCP